MEFEEIDLSELKNKDYINNNIRAARIITDSGFYSQYIILSTGKVIKIGKNYVHIISENISKCGLHKARFGDESYNPKISSKEAKKICKLLEENELTLDQIAEKVGTTRVIVYNIKHKLAWTNISDKYMIENHSVRADGTMRMTDEVAHKVCQDLEANELCLGEIAEKYGISQRSVSEIFEGKTHRKIAALYNVRNHTINPTINKKNMDKVEDICKLLQDTNLSVSEISKKLDVPPQLCYSILSRKAWKRISNLYDFSHRQNKPVIN